jgi:hypothetical protein
VLVATSIASRDAWLPFHVEQLLALVRLGEDHGPRGGWVHTLLNLFDEEPVGANSLRKLHRSLNVTTISGFKTRFWKAALSARAAAAYSHVWLADSDLVLHPAHFALSTLLRVMARTGALLVQPAVWGPGAGLHNAWPDAHGRTAAERQAFEVCDRSADEAEQTRAVAELRAAWDGLSASVEPARWPLHASEGACAACRTAVVEVKAPLFTSAAWQAVAALLARLPEQELLCDSGLDLVWCALVEHLVGTGCDCYRCSALNISRGGGACGASCVVSYATPIRHLDARSLGEPASTFRPNCLRSLSRALGRQQRLYQLMPTWRPRRSLLRSQPCWSAADLSTALRAERAPAPPPLSAAAVAFIRQRHDNRTRAPLPPPPASPLPPPAASAVSSRADGVAGPSAAHARRQSAWCGGADGGFSRAALDSVGDAEDDAAATCMLTPVHAPHFRHLAWRLNRTYTLAAYAPTTVVVFDDAAAAAAFCERHPRECALPGVHSLQLAALLGDAMYAVARSMLRTGGWAQRAQRRRQQWPDDSLAARCDPKYGGQCYQSLKKFYGAAAGPEHCRRFWVSDAETWPFRRYEWRVLAKALAGREGGPRA